MLYQTSLGILLSILRCFETFWGRSRTHSDRHSIFGFLMIFSPKSCFLGKRSTFSDLEVGSKSIENHRKICKMLYIRAQTELCEPPLHRYNKNSTRTWFITFIDTLGEPEVSKCIIRVFKISEGHPTASSDDCWQIEANILRIYKCRSMVKQSLSASLN